MYMHGAHEGCQLDFYFLMEKEMIPDKYTYHGINGTKDA